LHPAHRGASKHSAGPGQGRSKRLAAAPLVRAGQAGYLIAERAVGVHSEGHRSDHMRAAIQVEDLSKRYGEVVAVDRLSFEVPAGSTTALLGANGAGKTTTIAMILGLLAASAGRITVLGEEVPRRRARVLGRMNFSSPYVDLPLRLSARQNLLVYADLYRVEHADLRIRELAADLDLQDLLDRPTGRLSAGQKTRLMLGKALINQPELLLLDEPTASLDPDTADVIRGYLERYQRDYGATVLLASHNMAEVERLCSNVLMLKRGRLVDQGAPAELLRRYGRANLEQVFLDIARRSGDQAAPRAAE
jgi:ABC-2 type transport system ATP-binding protein